MLCRVGLNQSMDCLAVEQWEALSQSVRGLSREGLSQSVRGLSREGLSQSVRGLSSCRTA